MKFCITRCRLEPLSVRALAQTPRWRVFLLSVFSLLRYFTGSTTALCATAGRFGLLPLTHNAVQVIKPVIPAVGVVCVCVFEMVV